MELRAVSFDPGVTTGFGVGDIIDGEMLVRSGQEKLGRTEIRSFLSLMKPQVVIYERFEYRNRARAGLELFSRELIGIIELWCEDNDVTPVKQQPGSVINGYFSRKKLVETDVWKPGKIHANEALMHLLYWFTFGSGFQYNSKGYCLDQRENIKTA